MSRCPYCTYETPEPDDGEPTTRVWQEIAHMELEHPDVIAERLRASGIFDLSARFSPKVDE